MGGKAKKSKTAAAIERPGIALEKDLPSYATAAKKTTADRLAEIERVMPGASKYREQALPELQKMTGRIEAQYEQLMPWQQRIVDEYEQVQTNKRLIGQQEEAISKMISGELPQGAASQITRLIAERAGAGFNPAIAGMAGGFQTSQATLADQLRQSSEQRMLQGLQLAPSVTEQRRNLAGTTIGLSEAQRGITGTAIGLTEAQRGLQSTAMGWQQLADSFAYDPFETAGFVGPSQAYGQQKAAAEQYDAKVNAANQASKTNQIIGAVGTAVAIGAAPFTGGASLGLLGTTLPMMGGGSAGGGGGGGGGGIGQFGGGGGMGFTNPFGAKPVSGYGGQTYVPSQGGDFYKPISGSIYGK